MVLSLQCADT